LNVDEQQRYRATSWSGSEDRRRPQGVCLPPARPPVVVPRFAVPAGTPCRVSRVSPLAWRQHTTRRDLGFDRFETYRGGLYVFREGFYLVEVHRRHVRHREDSS
jgi:hypothetical protein